MMNRERTIFELLTNTNTHYKEENKPNPFKRARVEKSVGVIGPVIEEETNGWKDGDGDPCPICKQYYK
eukprot:g7590.t1